MPDDQTLFDWSTEPPSPSLSTRTGAFEFPPEPQPHRSRPNVLHRQRAGECALRVRRVLADGLDPVRPAAAVAATLSLNRTLLERVQVRGSRRRADVVRLRDVAAVAVTVDPHRRVAVRGAVLQRRRQRNRRLVVRGVLADRLRCHRHHPEPEGHPGRSGSRSPRSQTSRRCSTGRRRRRPRRCRRSQASWRSRRRPGPPPRRHLPPACSRRPGRWPGCRLSHNRTRCRPEAGPHPARARSGWPRSRTSRRCSTARRRRRRRHCRPAPARCCSRRRDCSAADSAAAVWSFEASWPIACVPPPAPWA